jgi:rhodanese-related sulfurtransferase
MKKSLLTFLLSVTILLAACQGNAVDVTGEKISVDGGAYTSLQADQLNEMLKNKDFVLVNVHIPFEGNIASTDLSIPYDQIEQNLTQLPADKNAKIVLYCRSGRMSQIAAEKLVSLGYTNISDLKGGMVAWERAGHEIQK